MGFESFPQPNIDNQSEKQEKLIESSERNETENTEEIIGKNENLSREEFPKEETTHEQEEQEQSLIQETISRNINNPYFKEVLSFKNPDQINEQVFQRALDTLLNTENTKLSQLERLKLFRETLEYYSSKQEIKKPLMHSSGSYGLRKALEEGFSGGHGSFSGEAGATREETNEVQKGLSVTHPEYASAESFQQLFARLSSRKEDRDKYLSIDSEKITNKTIPEVFLKELYESLSKDEMRELLAKRIGVKPEAVSDEVLEKMSSAEAQKVFIKEFNKRQYLPNLEKIRKEILPNIEDPELREELEHEAEHPFPCIITFESSGKEKHLTTVSRGEKPTHIPFEDFYWDKMVGEDIREVRVPQNQMKKVEGWLQNKGIKEAKIVPVELFEVKRIIQEKV